MVIGMGVHQLSGLPQKVNLIQVCCCGCGCGLGMLAVWTHLRAAMRRNCQFCFVRLQIFRSLGEWGGARRRSSLSYGVMVIGMGVHQLSGLPQKVNLILVRCSGCGCGLDMQHLLYKLVTAAQ
jgi:hypothetical protein